MSARANGTNLKGALTVVRRCKKCKAKGPKQLPLGCGAGRVRVLCPCKNEWRTNIKRGEVS